MKKIFTRSVLLLSFCWMCYGKSTAQSFSVNVSPVKNLHNTNGACGNSASSNDAITVSGLSTLSNTFVLRQIDITFEDCGTGSKNYNNIILRIQAPNGKCTVFYNTGNFLTVASGQHMMSFISPVTCINPPDNLNSNSSKVDSTLNGNYGYFATYNASVAVNLIDTFSGIDPNGTWRIYYTDKKGSSGFASVDPCVSAIKLTFGNPAVTDYTADGDNCINPIVWNGTPFCATTNGKSNSTQMPGWQGPGANTYSTIGGSTCNWNAANNNDVWIEFTPSVTDVCISVSGLDENLQSVVVTDPDTDGDNNPCTGSGNGTYWNLVSCPDRTGTANDIYSGTSGTQRNQNHCFTASAGTTYYLVVDGNGGAESPFYVDGNFIPVTILPVTFTYFWGKEDNNINTLYWQTASELNNKEFEIECSTDGADFFYLATVEGNGTSNVIHNYQYLHHAAILNDVIYYRLKQVDFNGNYNYSAIIAVKNKTYRQKTITIYPNPSNNTISIKNITSKTTYKIFDAIGNVITDGIYQPYMEIAVDQLPAGIYFLKMQDGYFFRFIKE